MRTSTPTNSPITARFRPEDRALLERLAAGGTATAVLQRGLHFAAEAELKKGLPLYPRLVDDEDVREVIEQAARAAVAVLDSLFPPGSPETRGVSSNFQGKLVAHMRAMLTGRVGSFASTHLQPLLMEESVFGGLRCPASTEGITFALDKKLHGDEQQVFDSERRQFVPLAKVQPGSLYTNEADAIKDMVGWLRGQEMSLREFPMKLCLLSWEKDGPLELAELARDQW